MVAASDSASGMRDKDSGSGKQGKGGGSGELINDRLSVTVGQYGASDVNAYKGGILKSKSDPSTKISLQH